MELVLELIPLVTAFIYMDLNGMSNTDILALIHQLIMVIFSLEGWMHKVPHQKQHTPNSLALQSEKN